MTSENTTGCTCPPNNSAIEVPHQPYCPMYSRPMTQDSAPEHQQERPAAVVAFEEVIKRHHLRVVKRHFLINDNDEPTHWYYYIGRMGYPEPTFPDIGVIDFENENDEAVGRRAAENIVETIRRRNS